MSRSPLFDLDHNTDIAEEIAREFPSRYRNAERLQAVMQGFGDAVQMLESWVYEYLADTTLNSAVGEQLDFWGSLVGESRGPFDDDVYRDLIQARALINISTNNIDDIIKVYRASTSAKKVWYYDHPPAGFRVEALRYNWLSDARIGRTLEHMKIATNAAVDYTLVESLPGQLRMSPGGPGLNSRLSRTLN